MTDGPHEFRVILYCEDGMLLAECCETGVLGTGDNRNAALLSLRAALREHAEACAMEGEDLYVGADPAVLERYDKAIKHDVERALLYLTADDLCGLGARV